MLIISNSNVAIPSSYVECRCHNFFRFLPVRRCCLFIVNTFDFKTFTFFLKKKLKKLPIEVQKFVRPVPPGLYKSLNGFCPIYLSSLLHYRTSTCCLRSVSSEPLLVPGSNYKTYGGRSFSVCAPKLWNNLPYRLRKSSSLVAHDQYTIKNLDAVSFSSQRISGITRKSESVPKRILVPGSFFASPGRHLCRWSLARLVFRN